MPNATPTPMPAVAPLDSFGSDLKGSVAEPGFGVDVGVENPSGDLGFDDDGVEECEEDAVEVVAEAKSFSRHLIRIGFAKIRTPCKLVCW